MRRWRSAARIMRDQDIGYLCRDRPRAAGRHDQRSGHCRARHGWSTKSLSSHRSRRHVSERALTCSVEDSVDQACDLMATNLIKNLPVLDRRKRLVGLISLRDISGQHGEVQAPSGDLLQAARDEFGSCPQRRAREGLSVACDQGRRDRACSGRRDSSTTVGWPGGRRPLTSMSWRKEAEVTERSKPFERPRRERL